MSGTGWATFHIVWQRCRALAVQRWPGMTVSISATEFVAPDGRLRANANVYVQKAEPKASVVAVIEGTGENAIGALAELLKRIAADEWEEKRPPEPTLASGGGR